MFDQTQQKLILQLMTSPQWKVFEQLAQEICVRIQNDPVSMTTEWEAVRDTLMKEGQQKGIMRLMQEAQLQAQQGHEKS